MLVLEVQNRAKAIPVGRISELIKSVGTKQYGAEVLATLAAHIQVDSAIIFRFERERLPCIQDLATSCSRSNLDRTAQTFVQTFSHLDPNANIIEVQRPAAQIFFTRTESLDIPDQKYWQTCWQQSGVVDRCSYIAGEPTKWWALNLYRERTTGTFSRDELSFLLDIGPLIGPLTQKHLEFQHAHASLQHQSTIEVRDLGVLTTRESQVCHGIANGQTAEGIAIDLRIGLTSVVTYRKRAYAKLGISSRHELLKMFMHQNDTAARENIF